MRTPSRLLVLSVLVAAVVAVALLRRGPALPARIHVETLRRDLLAAWETAVVTRHPPGVPPRPDGVQLSAYLDGRGGYRRAIVAPAPTSFRYRLAVEPGDVLRASAGVQRDESQPRSASGIRFSVRAGDVTLASRVLNPARTRHDRSWLDLRVPLQQYAGSEIDLTLVTEAESAAPLAGSSAWSVLRVLREDTVSRQPAAADAPNLLVIVVDTLRADRLGCYGASPSPSPTLDAFAAGGLVFERAVAQASWTMPSVASILTGLHPRAHGVFGGALQWGRPPEAGADADWAYLSDSITTFADLALRGGITTFGVSTNPTVTRGTNLARGFETFLELEPIPEHSRWPHAERVNERFLDWVRRHRRHRFLAYLHYMDVHEPYQPPAALRPDPPEGVRRAVRKGRIHPLRAQRRGTGPPLTGSEIAYLQRLYDGEIRAWDAAFAALLVALDELGLRGTTNVIVTSDHGEEFQEHGRLGHGSQLFDESLLVPLVLAGPSVGAGRVAAQAQGIDILPTAAALLGLPPSDLHPGRNLLALRAAEPVVSETQYGIDADGGSVALVAIRTPEAKLLHAPEAGWSRYYDLTNDPGEQHPRTRPVGEDTLRPALDRWRSLTLAAEPAARRDPRFLERLRALGYLD